MLHRPVTWLATRIAEREVDEQHASDTTLLDDVAGAPDHHGGDSSCFKVARNQTHGLVAHRSKRDQEGDINLVFGTPLANRCGIKTGTALAVFGGDAEEPMIELADLAVLDE